MSKFVHPDDALAEADTYSHIILMLTSDADLSNFICYKSSLHTLAFRVIDLIKEARDLIDAKRNGRHDPEDGPDDDDDDEDW